MVNDGLVGDYFDHSSLEEIKCPNLGDVVHECLFDLGLNDYRLIEPRFIDLGPREYFQIIPRSRLSLF